MPIDDPRFQNARVRETQDPLTIIYPQTYYDEIYRGIKIPGPGFRALQELFGRSRVTFIPEDYRSSGHKYKITLQAATLAESRELDIASSMQTSSFDRAGAEQLSNVLEKLEGQQNHSIAHFFNGGFCCGFSPGCFGIGNFHILKDGKEFGELILYADYPEQMSKNRWKYERRKRIEDKHAGITDIPPKKTRAQSASGYFSPELLLEESDLYAKSSEAWKVLKHYNWSECMALREATGVTWHIVDMSDGKEAFQADVAISNGAKTAFDLGDKLRPLLTVSDRSSEIIKTTQAAGGKITIPGDLIDETAAAKIAKLDVKYVFEKAKATSATARSSL